MTSQKHCSWIQTGIAILFLLTYITNNNVWVNAFSLGRTHRRTKLCSVKMSADACENSPMIIGVAADSGCGKSTFMRRLISSLGGKKKVGPLGGGFLNGGWETNTLASDLVTVICLDDFHLNDRAGRKVSGLTALDPRENNFDIMYEQLKNLKNGESIEKPIYNHVNGTLDKPEVVSPTPIIIIEGLHPMYDKRVRNLIDFSLYLDISDDVKLNWKIQRDMEERGHSLESIMASIESRKPDFDEFIAPQKKFADFIIEVLPTKLNKNDTQTLRVRSIQKYGIPNFSPCFLFDEGSKIEWVPCQRKLSRKASGLKFTSGPEMYYGQTVQVLEMDGMFGNLQELVYVEHHLQNSSTKYYGDLCHTLLKNADAPGSDNGTGLMQTLAAFSIRNLYEQQLKSVKA